MDPNNIPQDFVGKFAEMDPTTEDLLEGCELKDGMIILIEGSINREDLVELDPDSPTSSYRLDRLREVNRWCKIDRVRFEHHNTVSFIATYADGTKRKRTYSTGHAWFVKLDSMISEAKLTCDHAIGEEHPHCLVAECHNYLGRFSS